MLHICSFTVPHSGIFVDSNLIYKPLYSASVIIVQAKFYVESNQNDKRESEVTWKQPAEEVIPGKDQFK